MTCCIKYLGKLEFSVATWNSRVGGMIDTPCLRKRVNPLFFCLIFLRWFRIADQSDYEGGGSDSAPGPWHTLVHVHYNIFSSLKFVAEALRQK